MAITSGATKAVEVVMDVQALAMRLDKMQGRLVEHVSAAMAGAACGDPLFIETEALLKTALEFDSKEDIHAHVQKARRALGAAIDSRMNDRSLCELRAALRDGQHAIEEIQEECAHVVKAAAQVRATARLSVGRDRGIIMRCLNRAGSLFSRLGGGGP